MSSSWNKHTFAEERTWFQEKGDGENADYRCEDKKKVCEISGVIGAVRQVLAPFYLENPHHHPQKKKKKKKKKGKKKKKRSSSRSIWRYIFTPGLKLSNYKPGCWVAAVHTFAK